MFGYRSCMTGLLAFRMLGGRFWAIAPSSYTAPGSFARQSLPATEGYVGSGSKNDQLQVYYKRWGCHTCGSKVGDAIGDHMPPKAIGELQRNPRYRFYPQCRPCSGHQGGTLSSATRSVSGYWPNWRKIWELHAAGQEVAYNHAAKPRFNHLAGGIFATPAYNEQFLQEHITAPLESLQWDTKNIPKNIDASFDWIKKQLKGRM